MKTTEKLVSFVVVAVTPEEFPPRTYSVAYWDLTESVAKGIIAADIAAAYEKLGVGILDIRVLPLA